MNLTAFERAAVVADMLMRGPCTLKMLCLELGFPERNTERVMPIVKAFKARGSVYICGWQSNRWPVFAWQPAPFRELDVPRPAPICLGKKAMAEIRRAANSYSDAPIKRKAAPAATVVNSVFALGQT